MKASFSHLPFSPFEGRLARKKASFSYLQLSDLEGRLARKLRFHIFHFVFTSSTLTFRRMSRTKASFSNLRLADLREVSHDRFVFTSSTYTL